ncbi:MAG: 5'-methylthioadenosine/adenosylhomocysteine nucleosidase [Mangrovibacterium sp.]
MKIGIIGAMHEEVMLLKQKLSHIKSTKHGARTFYESEYAHHEVVLCLSGWGKVAAAATTTTLVESFGVEQILFVGLAGSLQAQVCIGDIVVGNRLVQHDMDLKDFTMMGDILPPFYKKYAFQTPEPLVELGSHCAKELQAMLREGKCPAIHADYQPNVHIGAIGTGDQFVSSAEMKQTILLKYNELLCTEMEGAAIAQVANDYQVPYLIIRVISDNAADNAHEVFAKFLFEDIGHISVQLLQLLLRKL